MSEIMTPGAPTGIPSGFATQVLTGGFPFLQLSANVAAADLIEFTGVITAQDITVLIPQPLFPTQTAGTHSFSTPTATGWMKILKNSTSGAFNVLCKALGGPNSLALPVGESLLVYSPDGLSVFAVSGSPTGVVNNAFSSGIIYRPGGAAGGNVFPTWQGVMAAFDATNGNVDIQVDDSIVSPASIPVGVWDLQGRGQLVYADRGFAPRATVSLPDGAQLLNPLGWTNVQLNCAPATMASVSFTSPLFVTLGQNAAVQQDGTRPVIDFASTAAVIFEMTGADFFNAAQGKEIFNVAGGLVALVSLGPTQYFPPTNVLASAPTSTVFFERDATSQPILLGASALGTFREILLSGAVQLDSVIISGPPPLVVDAAFLIGSGSQSEQIIFCKPLIGGITEIDLPDATQPMNKGRVLIIVDDNGGSVASPIHLVPFGTQSLNGTPGPAFKALASNWGTWTVTCDGAQWVVSQQAGI